MTRATPSDAGARADTLTEVLASYRRRLPILKTLARNLERNTSTALQGLQHLDRIYFRAKEEASFADKVRRKDYADPLTEIEDQVAGRILVHLRSDLRAVTRKLKQIYHPVEQLHHQPTARDGFGYETIHLVFKIPPDARPNGWAKLKKPPPCFEFQVRTLFMHAWAEPQHHLGYKNQHPDDLPRKIWRELAWTASAAWGADEAFDRILKSKTKKRTPKR